MGRVTGMTPEQILAYITASGGPDAVLAMRVAEIRAKCGCSATRTIRSVAAVMRVMARRGVQPDPPPSDTSPAVTVSDDGMQADVTLVGTDPPTIAEMMEAHGLSRDDWVPPESIETRAWTTTMRRDDQIVQAKNWHARAKFSRRVETLWPSLIECAPMPRLQPSQPRDIETWLVVPDMQMGYIWRDTYRYLDPFHDRLAISCAIQLAERIQPTGIIFCGDDLDLAAQGTYANSPYIEGTFDPSTRELRWTMQRFREACRVSRIVKLTGNHEQRWIRNLLRGQAAADMLQAFGDSPMRWLAEERLRLGEIDVEVLPDYGDVFWFLGGVGLATHGEHVGNSAGSKTMASSSAMVMVHGHTHKRYVYTQRIDTPSGPRERIVGSPGCLARVDADSPLPAATNRPDYHPGVGVVTWDPRHQRGEMVNYPIDRGRMLSAPGGPIVGRNYSGELVDVVHPAVVRRCDA